MIGLLDVNAIERRRRFRDSGDHTFWPDSVSICDDGLLDLRHVRGHRQLTDAYLLALATKHQGRLVTFDRIIRHVAVTGASKANLETVQSPV